MYSHLNQVLIHTGSSFSGMDQIMYSSLLSIPGGPNHTTRGSPVTSECSSNVPAFPIDPPPETHPGQHQRKCGVNWQNRGTMKS